MNLNEDKVLFGIIHTKEVKVTHPYNKTICLHTEYGNLYLQRRLKKDYCDDNECACYFCCLESLSCLSCTCPMRFISKYNNVNMKTIKKLVVPIVKHMKEKYPDTDWENYFDNRVKILIERDEC